MLGWIRRRLYCRKHGHHYKFESYTLGGDLIRCMSCRKLEEWPPGLHEPKGYAKSQKRYECSHHFLCTDSTYGHNSNQDWGDGGSSAGDCS